MDSRCHRRLFHQHNNSNKTCLDIRDVEASSNLFKCVVQYGLINPTLMHICYSSPRYADVLINLVSTSRGPQTTMRVMRWILMCVRELPVGWLAIHISFVATSPLQHSRTDEHCWNRSCGRDSSRPAILQGEQLASHTADIARGNEHHVEHRRQFGPFPVGHHSRTLGQSLKGRHLSTSFMVCV